MLSVRRHIEDTTIHAQFLIDVVKVVFHCGPFADFIVLLSENNLRKKDLSKIFGYHQSKIRYLIKTVKM